MMAQVPPEFVVIIAEGFGPVPMTSRTFELIAAYDGQEIAIDGTTRLRGSLARPEVLIPLARTTAVRFLEEKGPLLEVGTNVRLLSPSYLGQMAQVSGLRHGPRPVQSGVVASSLPAWPITSTLRPGASSARASSSAMAASSGHGVGTGCKEVG
jgi:hypothetical protein